MSSPPKILLVDDDPLVRAAFKTVLIKAGYEVGECADGVEAIAWLSREEAKLIILDVEMPRMNGWKTLEQIRRRGSLPPVLMMTHVDDLDARVRGLDGGADDYLGKPCETPELLARVRALLRRADPSRGESSLLQFGDLTIDLERKVATRGGAHVRFTRTEYELLALLRHHAGKPVTRETMLEHLWGAATARSHTIDTHLWRLRRKLGDNGTSSRWLQNIPGIGYVLNCAANSAAKNGE